MSHTPTTPDAPGTRLPPCVRVQGPLTSPEHADSANPSTNEDMEQIIQRALQRAGARIDLLIAQECSRIDPLVGQEFRRFLFATQAHTASTTNDGDAQAKHEPQTELSSPTASSNA